MAARVKPVPAEGVTKLVSITIPADWWEAASRLAAARGVNRSQLVRSLLWDSLPESERQRLSHPVPHGRPGSVKRSPEITPPRVDRPALVRRM